MSGSITCIWGQSAATLSAGNRSGSSWPRNCGGEQETHLVLLDHPCAGLHPVDIVRLLDCLRSLLAVGHSLIVMEHRFTISRRGGLADRIGPGSLREGGSLLFFGTPCPH